MSLGFSFNAVYKITAAADIPSLTLYNVPNANFSIRRSAANFRSLNYFYSGRSLTLLCRAHQALVWDRRATSLRWIWYSTSNSASFSDNPGTSIARWSNRTVRSSVSSGVFSPGRAASA